MCDGVVRILGAVMAGAACAYFGIRQRFTLKKRAESLAQIHTSLEALENEISFSVNRLAKAFKAADRCGIFTLASESITETGAGAALKKAVTKMQDKLCLTDADCSALMTLATGLGRTDREGQIKNIRYVKSLLAAQQTAAETEYTRRARLYSSGGVLIGAAVVIVLI